MTTISRFLVPLLLLCFSFNVTSAQTGNATSNQSASVAISASASSTAVRFVSLGEVNQTRVQVFSADGAQVFDSSFRLGNLVDWQLQDQQGQHLGDGSYLFLITVRDFSGRLTQKYGTALLDQDQVYLEQSARNELSQAQAAALDSNKQTEALSSVDRVGAAGIAHASSTSSAESNTTVVQPTTTVATTAQAGGPVVSNVTGTGTANQVTKWIDNAGTLGDSAITETGGNVGIGTTTPGASLEISKSQNAGTSTILNNDFTTAGNGAYTGLLFKQGAANRFFFGSINDGNIVQTGGPGAAVFWNYTSGPMLFANGGSERMRITSAGFVGIGTTNPLNKFEVANGNVRVGGFIESTTGGFKFPNGTVQTTAATPGLSSVTHDATLTGNGTGGSPLGLAAGAVTLSKLSAAPSASGQVLTYDGVGLAWQTPAAGGSPTVFRHTRTVPSKCGPFTDFSVIDHPLLNGNPNAMIFVTALVGITGTNTNPNSNLLVSYSGAGFDTCPANRWLIKGGDVSDGAQFDVMVVGP